MFDQIAISCLFLALLASLIFTDWPAVWVFCCTMLGAYVLGLVDTAEVLAKGTNTGLITLILLILVSIGLRRSFVFGLFKICQELIERRPLKMRGQAVLVGQGQR